ncbi:flavin reductase family protein [Heyndrickxia acidicola]|uniref:Flavin reductase family protein n=1 Tax=Heyndrickxia acidicola TaxID=209389 RepID=A0ABU6MEA3_9BACI|nr:flavin reductase family protein [Heyndrickxia acidicola]MED1201587.1 flavin reductase family protein [Heyndrickxia acidicola]
MEDHLFRKAMAKFPTGVTVITTSVDGNPYGMTANAFMSLSLNPHLILISVANKAHMNQYIKQAGAFAVNILSKSQKEMSMHFAGQLKEKKNIDFHWYDGIPVLENSLVHLSCSVDSVSEAGDHTLFIGKVNNLQIAEGTPLTYYNGKYVDIC